MKYYNILTSNFKNFKITKQNSKKFLLIIHLAIFISLLAISASVIALITETKIDKIDKSIASKKTKLLLTNFWIENISSEILNIDNLKNQNKEKETFFLRQNEYEIILNQMGFASSLGDGMKSLEVKNLSYFIKLSLENLNSSINDFDKYLLSKEDKNLIKNYKERILEIESKFNLINSKNNKKEQEEIDESFDNLIEGLKNPKKRFDRSDNSSNQNFDNYEVNQNDENFVDILEQIYQIYLEISVSFLNEKKQIIKSDIKNLKIQIIKLANKETKSILIAFIIQVILFLLVQYFEFGYGLTGRKNSNEK